MSPQALAGYLAFLLSCFLTSPAPCQAPQLDPGRPEEDVSPGSVFPPFPFCMHPGNVCPSPLPRWKGRAVGAEHPPAYVLLFQLQSLSSSPGPTVPPSPSPWAGRCCPFTGAHCPPWGLPVADGHWQNHTEGLCWCLAWLWGGGGSRRSVEIEDHQQRQQDVSCILPCVLGSGALELSMLFSCLGGLPWLGTDQHQLAHIGLPFG